jgi:hypothetical protein
MRVLRDVVLHRTEQHELHAVSHVPGMAGEEMTLDLMGAGATLGLRVKVIDSRPMIVEGSVRHRIRLAVMDAGAEAPAAGGSGMSGVLSQAAAAESV